MTLDKYGDIGVTIGKPVFWLTFIGVWIAAIASWGFLLGVAFGWIVATIIGFIVAFLVSILWGPALVIVGVGAALLTYSWIYNL